MPERISRREMLARGLGAAGIVAGGGLPAAWAATQSTGKLQFPDRSAQAPTAPVSIQRCESFEPKLFREKLDKALDQIGGIGKLVRDKTVTVKLNLTGMTWEPVFGLPAYETYQTHPNTVAALCASLSDAGAKRIVLVENLYMREPPEKILAKSGWDVAAIKSAGDQRVVFEDTRNKGKWPSYSRLKVPWGGFVFPSFDVNARYEKTDVLISLAKLKEHACAGVTASVKNLFGVPPGSLYGDDAPNEDSILHRAAMFHSARIGVPDGIPPERDHGLPRHWKYRVPRITADIFGARPIDLAVVDGVRTIKGAEGHWNKGIGLIEPKLLLVGRNGVCTDAVCAAVMGFNPQADHMTFPFPGENHLRLLAARGVGTNDLKQIEVAGLTVKKALHPFRKKPAAG